VRDTLVRDTLVRDTSRKEEEAGSGDKGMMCEVVWRRVETGVFRRGG
jgi:hypothetical protein